MKFLYPEFLWALTILLIPIVIHLFNFKRYKTIYFSNVSFLKSVEQTTKSTKNLKNYLILATRLLAFAFIVLAFAQPYFDKNNHIDSNKNPIQAFYIDNSYSMQAKGVNGELLLDAKERVRELVNKAPLGTNFIVGTNSNTSDEKRLLSKSEAHEKIDEIEFSSLPKQLNDVLRIQEEVFSKHSNSQIQHFILSDYQKLNLESTFHSEKLNERVFPIQFTPLSLGNLSIDSIWFDSPFHSLRSTNKLNVKITNYSEKKVSNAIIDFNIDAYQNSIYSNFKPNESIIITVDYKEKSTGQKSGAISINDNQLIYDNRFFLSYNVRPSINILLLNGKDAVSNIKNVYDLDSYYKLDEKNFSKFTSSDIVNVDLIILNGINSFPSGSIELLTNFNKSVGDIAFFPGKDLDFISCNKLLSSLDLSTIKRLKSTPTNISQINNQDPFYSGVFTSKVDKIKMPPISKYYETENSTNSMSTNLINLQNELPLFQSSHRKNKAYSFLSSLSKDFNSFTSNGLFPTIILRMGELSQRNYPQYINIGSTNTFPIPTEIGTSEIIHIHKENKDFIPSMKDLYGIKFITLPVDLKIEAGNYTISGDKDIGTLSLNYQRTESQMEIASEQEINDFFVKSGYENIKFAQADESSLSQLINVGSGSDNWKWFVFFALIFLLIEMLIIRLIK